MTAETNNDRIDPTPARWLKRLIEVRQTTAKLVTGLSSEDCALQSMPDASPLKWHLAHTTWFFEVFVLERYERNFAPFHPSFRVLFNSYYNGIGDKHPRPERGLVSRPSLEDVLAYRADVDARLHELAIRPEMANTSLDPTADAELDATVELGIQHEQQHQELMLTDFKHLLSRNPMLPAYRVGWPLTTASTVPLEWVRFDGGLGSIGASAGNFSFDNERPRHKVYLEPFELATRPITYGDCADFIEDGGYGRPELWLSLGWDWVRQHQVDRPLYWRRDANGWQTFSLRGLVPIAREVPAAHLSYFEADAMARWQNARLPTEAEWEHAAQMAMAGSTEIEGNFFDNGIFHPLSPSRVHQQGELAQLWGDVWEWTSSSYEAYPGFSAARGAVGEYNGKFMCNQYVLRGGSCATPRSHIRTSYRNFFPPEARWQFSGARIARSLAK